jgi:hypothetical protein
MYHVIPGKALKVKDLIDGDKLDTLLSGQTVMVYKQDYWIYAQVGNIGSSQ